MPMLPFLSSQQESHPRRVRSNVRHLAQDQATCFKHTHSCDSHTQPGAPLLPDSPVRIPVFERLRGGRPAVWPPNAAIDVWRGRWPAGVSGGYEISPQRRPRRGRSNSLNGWFAQYDASPLRRRCRLFLSLSLRLPCANERVVQRVQVRVVRCEYHRERPGGELQVPGDADGYMDIWNTWRRAKKKRRPKTNRRISLLGCYRC